MIKRIPTTVHTHIPGIIIITPSQSTGLPALTTYHIFRFFDNFSGSVAWDPQLAGDKVQHCQQVLGGAIASSFSFGC